MRAPGKFPQYDATNESIDRLVAVARQEFDNVVVDMGSRLDLMGTSLFKDGAVIYLVIQAGIAGLRNSNRLISQYFSAEVPRLEIVLNRYEPRSLGVAEDQITKALTRPAQWKIPNDYNAVRRMQHTAVPLALEDSPISRLIHQMARKVCGLPPAPEKKSGFSLKSFSRGFSSKPDLTGEPQALTQLGLNSGANNGVSKPEVTEKTRGQYVLSARSAPAPTSERPAPTQAERADRTEPENTKRIAARSINGPSQQAEPETRTYKGATYVKGPDGEWHIKKTASEDASSPQASAASQPVSNPVHQSSAPSQPVSTPIHQVSGETRSYKGSTYVKGADGEWHLQKPEQTLKPEPMPKPEQPLKPEIVKVQQPAPTLSWATPAPITFGAALGAGELNARPSVAGKLEYTPAAGEMLTAGTHTLSVIFTPAGDVDTTPLHTTVTLTVNKATPVITWSAPATIVYGVALGSTEFNASASVPGKFAYSPDEGTVPGVGAQTLTATFTPADNADYTTAQAIVSIMVAKAQPAISWPTPAPISYGTALGSAQLNATSQVRGSFSYNPASDSVPGVGAQTLTAIFTPADDANYTTAQATVSIMVGKAQPAISWPTPGPISYGIALGSAQLNATSQVPGSFTYNPAPGVVPGAGAQTLTAIFTPADDVNYTTAQATVSIMVAKGRPAITWQTPSPVSYGTALGSAQLNAASQVPGSFSYNPASGTVLAAGVQKLTCTFTPTDTADYATVQSEVALAITKASPVINWPTPASIVYGTALGNGQLNATASAPGKFVYIPAVGAVLSAGTHYPSVTFTPTDAANYTMAQAAVKLAVTRATPSVTWRTPSPISYGTALSAIELNATASIPGRFTYTPEMGELLAAGTHTLSVTFTPTDSTDYAPVQATTQLTVAKAKQTILSWSTPAPISYGIALSVAQLNATAEVPGTFAYSPAADEILPTGTHKLAVTFTPTDANFPAAQATVSLTVTKATPVINWPKPASISFGSSLSATQLNATSSVPGTFAYTPGAGETPGAGTHTLKAVFTPTDSANAAAAQATVQLTVTKATPIITWQQPAAIAYGTALSANQLNAQALVPGTFVYTPAEGTVIASGSQTLSATFTPTDSADYTTAQATVQLVVEGLPNIASLIPATADVNAELSGLSEAGHEAQQADAAINRESKPETRTYKGATYVKGADGQWYLQKS